MSSPALKNMDYKEESWFKCKISGNLGCFYRFLRPMAAILDFRTFMSQILIDFFGSVTISSRIETFVYQLYKVGPTSKALGRRCINVLQIVSVYWDSNEGQHTMCGIQSL